MTVYRFKTPRARKIFDSRSNWQDKRPLSSNIDMIFVFREVNDDMQDRSALFHRLRAIVALILVLLYILGLVAMLAGRVQLALILWVVSTLGGIGLLYWMRTVTRRKEEAEREARGEKAPGEQ
jgi:Flp pilus assembly protein TadB